MDTCATSLYILVLIRFCFGQWKPGLCPPSENGFNFLQEALQPMKLHSEKSGNDVRISVLYQPRVFTVPHWEIGIGEFDAGIRTLGKVEDTSHTQAASVVISQDLNIKQLYFHLASNIGTIAIKLDYHAVANLSGEAEIPNIGVRPLVPPVYRPLPVESTCIGQYINVRFERDADQYLSSGIRVNFILADEDYFLTRVSDLHYHHFLEKKKAFYGMEIELESEFVRNGSEVEAVYSKYDPNEYMERISVLVHSLIEPPDPLEHVRLHDTLGLFHDFTTKAKLPEIHGLIGIDCAAFGYPRPTVKIFDSEGKQMSTQELRLGSGMTSHVLASYEALSSDEMEGTYTCIATSGEAVIKNILEVRMAGKDSSALGDLQVIR